jgi:hypothetical protein
VVRPTIASAQHALACHHEGIVAFRRRIVHPYASGKSRAAAGPGYIDVTLRRLSSSAALSQPYPLATPLKFDPEIEMWEIVRQEFNPDDIRKYLEMYPQGRFVAVAYMKLEALQRVHRTQESYEQEDKCGLILPLTRGRDVLNPIANFFQTLGAVGGAIGAILVIAASSFIDIKIPLKDISILKKLLFVFSGTLVGGLFFISVFSSISEGKNIITCTFLGAFWLHVVTTSKNMIGSYLKGMEVKILEKTSNTSNTRSKKSIPLEKGRNKIKKVKHNKNS